MDKAGTSGGPSSPVDLREAQRASLMLRSAKVVCQTGEYVAVIRDVSTLGVGLSFLHKAPPEPRILLELSNGVTYPIERVWDGKSRAGYRFASPIDLDEFVTEESPFDGRAVRLRIDAEAEVLDRKHRRAVQLRDLSCDGASFECEDPIDQSHLTGFFVGGVTQRQSKICWNNDIVYGIKFKQPITIEELAQAALKLQPYCERHPGSRTSAFSVIRAA